MNERMQIAKANPMNKDGLLDNVCCENDAQTLLLLNDLAEGFHQLTQAGHWVDEVCIPRDQYDHLLHTSDAIGNEIHPTLLGAKIRFSDTLELRSEDFGKFEERYNRRVRNGCVLRSEPVSFDKDSDTPDRFRITARLLQPVFRSMSLFGAPTVIIRSRSRPLVGISDEEWKAIDTLREMITELEYRKYLKDGFILVPGKSGRIYQVFRKRSHTKVGRMVR